MWHVTIPSIGNLFCYTHAAHAEFHYRLAKLNTVIHSHVCMCRCLKVLCVCVYVCCTTSAHMTQTGPQNTQGGHYMILPCVYSVCVGSEREREREVAFIMAISYTFRWGLET